MARIGFNEILDSPYNVLKLKDIFADRGAFPKIELQDKKIPDFIGVNQRCGKPVYKSYCQSFILQTSWPMK